MPAKVLLLVMVSRIYVVLLCCRRILFFDSLGGRNPWAIDSIKSWLADEAKVRSKEQLGTVLLRASAYHAKPYMACGTRHVCRWCARSTRRFQSAGAGSKLLWRLPCATLVRCTSCAQDKHQSGICLLF
jgi:hypothetical protein